LSLPIKNLNCGADIVFTYHVFRIFSVQNIQYSIWRYMLV